MYKNQVFLAFFIYDFFKFTAIIPVIRPESTQSAISIKKVHFSSNEPPIIENKI